MRSSNIAERISHSIRRSPSQEPFESSTIAEPVVIAARLISSVPSYLFTSLGRYHTDLPSSVGHPYSAAHFSGHCFRLIPASSSFPASAFPVPPFPHWVPSRKAAARFGSSSPRFWVPQKNGAEKGDIFMSYLC